MTAQNLDRTYREWLNEGLDPSTVHHLHRVLSASVRQAVKWGLIGTQRQQCSSRRVHGWGGAASDYLERALHAQCDAHLIRHLAAAMGHDDTKLWARLMTRALLDGAEAAGQARDAGDPRVDRYRLDRMALSIGAEPSEPASMSP